MSAICMYYVCIYVRMCVCMFNETSTNVGEGSSDNLKVHIIKTW